MFNLNDNVFPQQMMEPYIIYFQRKLFVYLLPYCCQPAGIMLYLFLFCLATDQGKGSDFVVVSSLHCLHVERSACRQTNEFERNRIHVLVEIPLMFMYCLIYACTDIFISRLFVVKRKIIWYKVLVQTKLGKLNQKDAASRLS